ncbi:MAG: MFS transporter [Pseudomonadota bacterium]
MRARPSAGICVLIACALVSAVLGSVHAFSIFLVPLETALDVSRTRVSFTYSLALVFLTATVLLGPKIYGRYAPHHLFLGVGILGGLGALIAGVSTSVFGVWLGYGLLFGVANGLGYGFGLQYAARANPMYPGVAMGIVTAAYAFGAAVAPILFVRLLDMGGFTAAMLALAVSIIAASLVAALLVKAVGCTFSDATRRARVPLPKALIIRLWFAYGMGVAAGLMAIGHAAGIASAAGVTPWLAPAVIAVCNLCGSLIAGHQADHIAPNRVLPILAVISVSGLIMLLVLPTATLIGLALVGFAYGGTIAAYPAIIAKRFPGDAGPRAYGRVFTAWGFAGLCAPALAGLLFDFYGRYGTALWLAAGLAVIAAILALIPLEN